MSGTDCVRRHRHEGRLVSRRWAGFVVVVIALSTVAVALPPAASAVGGGNWQQQSPLPTGQRLHAVDMLSANRAWAVGENGAIIQSADGGKTWRAQPSGTTQQPNAVRFRDAKHGWAMGNVSLYTTDGGATWRQGNGALGTVYGVEFADLQHGFATVSANFIYRTVNGGVSWTRQPMPFAVGRVQFFDALHGVASGARVARTSDGGATWQAVAGSEHGGCFITVKEGWYVANNTAEHTVDGGVTWQPQTLPPNTWANAVHFVDARNGWAVGAESNIVATKDGGATWVTQRGGTGSSVANRYPLEATDFADPSRGAAVDVCGTLLVTSDGGATWRQRLSGSCTQTHDLAATDANHAWAAQGDGEVLRTVQGGARWQRVILPIANLDGAYFGAADFVDNLHGWVVSSAGTIGDQYVFGTADGGRTWRQQGPHDDANLFGIDSADGQTVVAVGYICCTGPRITRSTDGGATWTIVPSPLTPYGGRFRAVALTGPTTGWIVGDGAAVLKTSDGGRTWVQQNPLGLYLSPAGRRTSTFPLSMPATAGSSGATRPPYPSWRIRPTVAAALRARTSRCSRPASSRPAPAACGSAGTARSPAAPMPEPPGRLRLRLPTGPTRPGRGGLRGVGCRRRRGSRHWRDLAATGRGLTRPVSGGGILRDCLAREDGWRWR